ncbi:MAG: hypothetical protein QOG15_1968 [Solirubrobacteraceae bacterium]|jgi:RNA polymerase sigma factor (sigma-70 family)|nr:hypothetical protein [Solirubrobacteraceae bacterium]
MTAGTLTREDLHSATDEQLLAAVVVGRETRRGEQWEVAKLAWRHLAARHHDRVRGQVVAFEFPGSPGVRIGSHEYEDAAQECFIRAVKMLGNFRGISVGEFLGALRTCVTNTCMDYCRRRLTRERGVAGNFEEPLGDDDGLGRFDAVLGEIAERKEDARGTARDELAALQEGIAAMDNEQMRDVLLRKMAGFSSREIAEALGLTVANVDQLCSRGVRKLRGVMDDA